MKEEKEEESFQGNCSDGGGLWRPREGRAQEGYLIAIRGVSYQYDSEFVPAQFFMCPERQHRESERRRERLGRGGGGQIRT